MTLQPVDSSNIRAIGHDPTTNTLRVQFKNGKSYDYAGVPPSAHAALMASDSKGQHLHKHIKSSHNCQTAHEEAA